MSRLPTLLAISTGSGQPAAEMERWCRRLLASGVRMVQVREKSLSDRALYELLRRLRARLPADLGLVVNGRPDIALAAGADGVHLPASGLPVDAVRRRFGGELLVGRSTHRLEEVEAAASAGADYVLFGPVWRTPGKEAFGPPAGVDALAAASAAAIPVYALGGVTIDRLAAAAAAGARGAAGIRCFQQETRAVEELVTEAGRCFSRRAPGDS